MESSCVALNQNSYGMKEFKVLSTSLYHQPWVKVATRAVASLPWLDLRVFYVKVCRCELNDSTTPECLTVEYVPLNYNTILEVNGARASIYSDGVTAVLRRDRVDCKSQEATFVSTDNVRVTGSVKFEVFDKDVLILSGVLDCSNGKWSMNCESDVVSGWSLLKGINHQSCPPKIEVYVAGCFMSRPIILTKMIELGPWKKLRKKSLLDTIPEHEATESQKDSPPANISPQKWEHLSKNLEKVGIWTHYMPGYMEGEDGELSYWFNAGVRVGVGLGLSICIGAGVGVGLLARTYQGTTRRLVRRLL